METKTKKGFPLGRIVATRNALQTLAREDMTKALDRHAAGDWGDLAPRIGRTNEMLSKTEASPVLGLPRREREEVLGHYRG